MLKNERNIDFRVSTTNRRIRQRQAKKALLYPLFQRGLGGFSTKFTILDRGYCGHEHLLEHNIINMNGRIYDPLLGQFMQADNFIQSPEDFIDHNRYAYCRNNPFKYTDPSGEEFVINILGMSFVIFGGSGSIGNDGPLDMSQFEDELARLKSCMDSDYQLPTNKAQTLHPIPSSGGGGGNIYVSKDKTLNLNQEVRKGDRIDVSDKNGNYIGWVEVVDYTRTKDGLNIIIDFYQFGTDEARYIREGQTIRTNYSNDPQKATTYNDPSKYQKDFFDNLPYYYTNELQRKYNRPVGGLARSRFGDGPSRDNKYQSNRETWWFAELSFFNVTSNSDIPLITFTYGFFYFNGVTYLYPLMIISPSEAHLSYFRK